MTKPNLSGPTYLVVDGDKVLLRTQSCLEAITFMGERKLPPSALFTQSYVAATLLELERARK